MNPIEIDAQADAWITYWLSPSGSPERNASSWATDTFDLEYEDPETLWLLILAVHRKNQSIQIQQVLSAGMVEDLLVKHGDKFIDRVEAQAQTDSAFARLLGGVWKNRMSDEAWSHVQAVWDRRGWDGIPE
jgi:hypothetical protein